MYIWGTIQRVNLFATVHRATVAMREVCGTPTRELHESSFGQILILSNNPYHRYFPVIRIQYAIITERTAGFKQKALSLLLRLK